MIRIINYFVVSCRCFADLKSNNNKNPIQPETTTTTTTKILINYVIEIETL